MIETDESNLKAEDRDPAVKDRLLLAYGNKKELWKVENRFSPRELMDMEIGWSTVEVVEPVPTLHCVD